MNPSLKTVKRLEIYVTDSSCSRRSTENFLEAQQS